MHFYRLQDGSLYLDVAARNLQGKGGVGVCVGSDAPSCQLDMGQGAAKAGTPLPRGELVGEARGGLARRPDICCCDPSTPQHSPTLNPPGLNGRHEPDEGTRGQECAEAQIQSRRTGIELTLPMEVTESPIVTWVRLVA